MLGDRGGRARQHISCWINTGGNVGPIVAGAELTRLAFHGAGCCRAEILQISKLGVPLTGYSTLIVVKVLCHVSQFDWDVGYCHVYDRTKVCYGYVY